MPGDNTNDSIIWFPGDVGHNPGGEAQQPPTAHSLAFSLLGPTRINFDTDDFLNPATTNGPVVFSVPANSLIQVFVVAATDWDQSTEIDVSISETGELDSFGGGVFNSSGLSTTYAVQGLVALTRAEGNSTLGERWVLTLTECDVAVAGYPGGDDPTTGAIDVYAIVATPSS